MEWAMFEMVGRCLHASEFYDMELNHYTEAAAAATTMRNTYLTLQCKRDS